MSGTFDINEAIRKHRENGVGFASARELAYRERAMLAAQEK